MRQSQKGLLAVSATARNANRLRFTAPERSANDPAAATTRNNCGVCVGRGRALAFQSPPGSCVLHFPVWRRHRFHLLDTVALARAFRRKIFWSLVKWGDAWYAGDAHFRFLY